MHDPTHVNPQLETDCTAKLHKDSIRLKGHELCIYYWYQPSQLSTRLLADVQRAALPASLDRLPQ